MRIEDSIASKKSFSYPKKCREILVSLFLRWNDPSLNDENLFRHLLPSLVFSCQFLALSFFQPFLLFQVWLFIENPGQIESSQKQLKIAKFLGLFHPTIFSSSWFSHTISWFYAVIFEKELHFSERRCSF